MNIMRLLKHPKKCTCVQKLLGTTLQPTIARQGSGTAALICKWRRSSIDDSKMSMLLGSGGGSSALIYKRFSVDNSKMALAISCKQPTETATVVEEWEEVPIDDLVNENFLLKARIAQLEAHSAELEGTVREDVCEEMSKQIEAMEHAFQVRIEDERIAMEIKFKRKLQILSREIARRTKHEADWVIRQLETKVQNLEDQLGQAYVAAPAHLAAQSTEEDLPLNQPAQPKEPAAPFYPCAGSFAEPEEPAAPLDPCAGSSRWWGDVLLDRINKHVEHMREHGVLAGRHLPRPQPAGRPFLKKGAACHVKRMQVARSHRFRT
jgi:hypothetical protein